MTAMPSMYRGFEQLLNRPSFAFYESDDELAREEIEGFFKSMGQEVTEVDHNILPESNIGVMKHRGLFIEEMEKLQRKYRYLPALFIIQSKPSPHLIS